MTSRAWRASCANPIILPPNRLHISERNFLSRREREEGMGRLDHWSANHEWPHRASDEKQPSGPRIFLRRRRYGCRRRRLAVDRHHAGLDAFERQLNRTPAGGTKRPPPHHQRRAAAGRGRRSSSDSIFGSALFSSVSSDESTGVPQDGNGVSGSSNCQRPFRSALGRQRRLAIA